MDLANDNFEDLSWGFTWDRILQVNPDNLQINDVPYELLDLPRRRIQNRDAARVVANEMIELLEYQNWELRRVKHDPDKNIWFFSFDRASSGPGVSIGFAVNGYNGQAIRGWVE